MIVLISGVPAPSPPVRAVTVTSDVMIGVPELVMNAFSPSITHSSRVLVEHGRGAGAAGVAAGVGLGQPEAAERPAGAQVGQPRLALLLGAEPVDRVGARGRRPASSVIAIDWSTRPSSSMATHSVVRSAPPPPYSSGKGRPNRPSSPIASTVSTGNVWSRSQRLGVRRDLALGEVAHDLAERLLLLGELDVHACDRTAPILAA